MSENTITINVDDSQITATEAKATEVENNVVKKMKSVDKSTDIAWLKAVAVVQQVESVLMQALRFAGITLDAVNASVLSTVNQALSVLVPLFTAQLVSGFQTASAVLGLISLSFAVANTAKLIQSSGGLKSYLNSVVMNLNYSNHDVF